MKNIKYQENQTEFVAWLTSLAPWDCFGTMTFRMEVTVASARKQFERWMRHDLPHIPCFYAIEQHPGGHGAHIHCLMRLGTRRRYSVWNNWFSKYGRVRLEPVEKTGGVVGYCAKYCIKSAFEKGWWNVLNVCGRWKGVNIELPTVEKKCPGQKDKFVQKEDMEKVAAGKKEADFADKPAFDAMAQDLLEYNRECQKRSECPTCGD